MELEEKFILLSFILGSFWGILAWEVWIKKLIKNLKNKQRHDQRKSSKY